MIKVDGESAVAGGTTIDMLLAELTVAVDVVKETLEDQLQSEKGAVRYVNAALVMSLMELNGGEVTNVTAEWVKEFKQAKVGGKHSVD